jgi:predicted aldo/keto reductase-like oxidoreductase
MMDENYLGADIPKLGFGLMRLPRKGEHIDIEQVKEMVDLFLDAGYTYFDTARAYGDSESAIKEALVDRYPRESYQLATKIAAWMGAKTAEDAHEMFQTSLKNTGAGYFDFYLLHNLGEERSEFFDRFDLWNYAAELKKEGLIKHLGFSMHDKAEVLDSILAEHGDQVEFVQLQVNWADWENPSVQSRACMEVCRKYDKPVVIMEPVKGGMLANLADPVKRIFDEADPNASYASWAIRFAASQPGIITVLSGMSSVDQMKDNIATMNSFRPLDDEELQVVDKAREALAGLGTIQCTSCEYCIKGCPKHVPIPGIMDLLNRGIMYGNDTAKDGYGWVTRLGVKASDCIECGQCEMACPQHLPIMTHLKDAAKLFE